MIMLTINQLHVLLQETVFCVARRNYEMQETMTSTIVLQLTMLGDTHATRNL